MEDLDSLDRNYEDTVLEEPELDDAEILLKFQLRIAHSLSYFPIIHAAKGNSF